MEETMTKHSLWLTVCLASITLVSPSARAQSAGCATQFAPFLVPCHAYGCSSSVVVDFPTGGGSGGTAVYYDTVFCCGVPILSYFAEGLCWATELRRPEVQERLASLAERSRLLVSNCKGRYVTYDSMLVGGASRLPKKRPLLDEHVLE